MALAKSLNKDADGSTRNDLGYLSEVNSCDSSHEVTSLHDEIMPQCVKEQNVREAFRIELQKVKLVRVAYISCSMIGIAFYVY